MNKELPIFCITAIYYVQQSYCNQATVDIYIKDFKIWVLPEIASVNKTRCGFKTSRKYRTGLIFCEGRLLKRLDLAYVHFILSYKYGTVYRDYLINYKKIEVCGLMADHRNVKYSNPLADIARNAIKHCCPQFDHACPFLPGWYNGSNIDINGTFTPLLPPVVPAGECFCDVSEVYGIETF